MWDILLPVSQKKKTLLSLALRDGLGGALLTTYRWNSWSSKQYSFILMFIICSKTPIALVYQVCIEYTICANERPFYPYQVNKIVVVTRHTTLLPTRSVAWRHKERCEATSKMEEWYAYSGGQSWGDVTRDDSQRRVFAQHRVAMLEQCCDHSKQCRNNVEMMCCVKNRRCKSPCGTSPLSTERCPYPHN